MRTRFKKENEMSSLLKRNHDVQNREIKMKSGGAIRCEAIFRGN
jgi:hypothetical protein